ncbi:MAG: succinylglutamate desuccinylase/aspartoacylase family protein, partial [Candidatus Vogelbacteria bacterium]|nr:succinylglutamate desuccinylase/aspartoacylase family protein [Candidatus Vogelbacteria bacterium]
RGRVLFGYGNPRAIKKTIRQIDANLNRMFKPVANLSSQEKKSYEYQRAKFLKKYLNQASALLDIHASCDPNSVPFIICEANASKIVKYLPVNLIVSGFDAIEPGGTDYYMNRQGQVGICIECGYRRNPATSQIAETAILNFLTVRGHISGKIKSKKQTKIKMFSLYLAKTNKFRLAKKFSDFAKLKSGELIGLDGKNKVLAPKNSIILFAQNTNKIGDEAFLLGKKKRPRG